MNVKRIVLLVLLIVLLAVIFYQIANIDRREIKGSSGSRSKFSKEHRQSQMRFEDMQIPRINLNKLNRQRDKLEQSERNLFVISQRKARTAETAALRREQSALEEGSDFKQDASSVKEEDAKLRYFRNVEYIGLGIIKDKRIAGIIINGYLYLGSEGDVIANRFTILKITDKFIEISIIKGNISQKIYLESG
jgi:hypothetical protein